MLTPGDPAHFTGDVKLGLVAGTEDVTLHLYEVQFSAGARTRWHTHSGEQVLLCLQGRCAVQLKDQPLKIIGEQEAVRIPPGVVHWHGALGQPASHLAVNIDTVTTWLAEVSPAEYRQALAQSD